MHEAIKMLDSYETMNSQELMVISGGLNKVAYDIGHKLGIVVNVYSTVSGIRRGGNFKRCH
ncbi:hypothetical protein FGL75_02990 [Weissella hellenica]|nr:hypothetical protein FGL75_02990 [Weissella hellenica]